MNIVLFILFGLCKFPKQAQMIELPFRRMSHRIHLVVYWRASTPWS